MIRKETYWEIEELKNTKGERRSFASYLQFLPKISSRVYSVNSRKLSEANICGAEKCLSPTRYHMHRAENVRLTIGLSGSLGSVITKFFSMRSSVVARSIPCRTSLSISSRSQLSDRSKSLVINTSGSMVGSSSSLPTLPRDFPLSLKKEVVKINSWKRSTLHCPMMNRCEQNLPQHGNSSWFSLFLVQFLTRTATGYAWKSIHSRSLPTGCAIVLRWLREIIIEVEPLHLFVLAGSTDMGPWMFHCLNHLRDGAHGPRLLPSW